MITPDPEKTAQIDAASAKIRELIAKRPPPCAETRRQAAAVVAASLASAVGGQVSTPPAQPVQPALSRPAKTLPKLAGFLLVFLVGCAPVGVAADAARQQALLCAGNATGPGRCQEVRNVEADNAQCWDAQVYTLTGKHALPPEVLAEVAAVVSRSP